MREKQTKESVVQGLSLRFCFDLFFPHLPHCGHGTYQESCSLAKSESLQLLKFLGTTNHFLNSDDVKSSALLCLNITTELPPSNFKTDYRT